MIPKGSYRQEILSKNDGAYIVWCNSAIDCPNRVVSGDQSACSLWRRVSFDRQYEGFLSDVHAVVSSVYAVSPEPHIAGVRASGNNSRLPKNLCVSFRLLFVFLFLGRCFEVDYTSPSA